MQDPDPKWEETGARRGFQRTRHPCWSTGHDLALSQSRAGLDSPAGNYFPHEQCCSLYAGLERGEWGAATTSGAPQFFWTTCSSSPPSQA